MYQDKKKPLLRRVFQGFSALFFTSFKIHPQKRRQNTPLSDFVALWFFLKKLEKPWKYYIFFKKFVKKRHFGTRHYMGGRSSPPILDFFYKKITPFSPPRK